MLRTVLAVALLCALSINADARPHSGPWQACVQTGDVMHPCAYQPDFLTGGKSVRVTMKRISHVRKLPEKSYADQLITEGLPKTTAKYARGYASHAIVGRPPGCPHAWCGCYLAARLGLSDRSLWVARNWARVGSPIDRPQPGAIVVWMHHVGLVQAAEGNRILVLSGNDGRRVRERWRSTRGVIAYRITE